MGRFQDWTISTKLLALVGVFVAGFLAQTAIAWVTLERIKVTGPLYQPIVQRKDVIADVMPPPEYILEAYLVALQLLEERDPAAQKRLIERGGKLRHSYLARHAHWRRELPAGEVRELLLVRLYATAMAFFEIRDRELIPAVLAGDAQRARDIAQSPLNERHDEHRQVIDEIIEQVQELSRRMDALNEDMRGQSQGASQISHAMMQLTDGARMTSASPKEFDSATEGLREVVASLRQELANSNAGS